MDLRAAVVRLEHDADAIAALFSGISDEQARWKPTAADWSLLEVICHLYDEEREDFRQRVDILLHTPDAEWPAIDPQGWVAERNYNAQDPTTKLSDFLQERRRSVEWLSGLDDVDWSSSGQSPWGDVFTAGQMLRCWMAHDMLHLRQMAELHYRYTEAFDGPGSVDYAGGW
jgi:hypothetical protein